MQKVYNLTLKNIFMDNIDDIFKVLYGKEKDDVDNTFYSNYYKYEVNSMLQDFIFYINSLEIVDIIPTKEEIANFIIYLEYVHIGNDNLVKKNIQKEELYNIANNIKEISFKQDNKKAKETKGKI